MRIYVYCNIAFEKCTMHNAHLVAWVESLSQQKYRKHACDALSMVGSDMLPRVSFVPWRLLLMSHKKRCVTSVDHVS